MNKTHCTTTTTSQSPTPLPRPRLDHPRDSPYGCCNQLHTCAKRCAGKSILTAITIPFAFSLTHTLDQFYHSVGCRRYEALDWQPFLRPAITLKIRERGMRRSVTPISHDHTFDPLYMWNQCSNGKGKHFALKHVLL